MVKQTHTSSSVKEISFVFLQLWFHNLKFRDAIYKWRSLEDICRDISDQAGNADLFPNKFLVTRYLGQSFESLVNYVGLYCQWCLNKRTLCHLPDLQQIHFIYIIG